MKSNHINRIMETTISHLAEIMTDVIAKRDTAEIDWDHKPSAAKWSKKEIIGHLIDSAQINLQRFVRCTYQEGFKLVYEQEEWVQAAHYQQAAIDELLALWHLLNRQIIRVLSNYPAGRLQSPCDSSRMAESFHTVEWLAEDYLVHMKHHLKQIYGSIN